MTANDDNGKTKGRRASQTMYDIPLDASQLARDDDDTKKAKDRTNIIISDGPLPQDLGAGDDEDDDEKFQYEPSTAEKILNYLLCRGDLASKKLDIKPVTLTGLFRYATKWDRIVFLIGCLCAIASGCGQPTLALISGRITNALLVYPARSKQFRNAAYQNVYIFLGVGCFLLIINFLQFFCFYTVCSKVIAKIRHNYVRAILRQNAGWLDKNHSGTLTSRLNDNIERVREGIGDKLGLLIRGCAMFVSAVVIAFIYQWRVALMMFGVAPATCAVMSFMSRKIGATVMKELTRVGKAGAIAEESILGVRTVQAFNGQEEMVDRYAAELKKGRQYALKNGFWGGFLGGFFFFVLFCFMGCGMLYASYLLKVDIIHQPGDVFICVMSMLLGAYFLGLISPHLMVLLNARVAAATIYATIDRTPPIDCYEQMGRKLDHVRGKIEFRNVHFRYPTRKNIKVLNGTSWTVEPGQTVALVGHSGCGKSTSVGLLTRLYNAESGQVLVDGNDITELNIDWLRNIIGIVQQEPILFHDTIAENLRYGNPNLTMERMIDVCKQANAHDFISKLPDGYETLIGEGGVQLSGGQKQRVAIARTIARDPKILLLDEATSALDTKSEAVVQAALNRAAEGRSTIVIAHRLSTVREANKIIVFEKGTIIEQGSHDELLRRGGRYAELVAAQQIKTEEEASGSDEDEAVALAHPTDLPRGISTQSSATRTGSEHFERAHSHNSSVLRASLRLGNDPNALFLAEQQQMYADQVKSTMKEDAQINAGYWDIVQNAQGNYLYLFFAVASAMIAGMQLPGLALTFGYVFEGFSFVPYTDGRMMHRIAMALIIYCSIGLGTWLFQTISSVLFSIISENLAFRFRVQSFSNILIQDASYFDNPAHAPGKLITRLASDAPNVKAVMDNRMMQVIFGTTAMLVNIAIAFIYCWQVAILGSGLVITLAVAMIGLALEIQRRQLAMVKSDEAGRIAIEAIENVRTIQLLTRHQTFYHKYETASKNQKRSELAKGWFEAINFMLSQTFLYFLMTITYALGIYIIYDGQKTSDKVFRSIISLLLASVAVMNSSSYFPEFVKARTAAGLLFAVIRRRPMTGDMEQGQKHKLQGEIFFEGVQFAYPQRPHQLTMRNLEFRARRGQTVALVGPSGSGKSTCISLLERFYDPTNGAVRFDGHDLKTLCLRSVREQMALVGQEPRLFAGTIKDNICFGLKNVSMDRIEKALETANAKNFVISLPKGLDTEVGEKGTQLSGGQKQRIAIARALVRDPAVLLLDEATSALDSESERAVQEALDRARAGRTCITIAHRLSSIQNSDLILFIEGGKVREQGTHQALVTRRGKYFELISQQNLA